MAHFGSGFGVVVVVVVVVEVVVVVGVVVVAVEVISDPLAEVVEGEVGIEDASLVCAIDGDFETLL